MRAGWIAIAAAIGGCGAGDDAPADADARAAPADAVAAGCPAHGLREPGRHRLFVQGHEGEPLPDGSYPFLHDHALCDDGVFALACDTPPATPPCRCSDGDGVWETDECPAPLGPDELVHGEHFLVGLGAYAEFRFPLCADITGDVTLYIPNFDEPGSRALHQVFALGAGEPQLVAEAIDDEPGSSGYNPFVRQLAGADPSLDGGGELLLRTTNLEQAAFSVMVWRPPSDYESWVLVTIPE